MRIHARFWQLHPGAHKQYNPNAIQKPPIYILRILFKNITYVYDYVHVLRIHAYCSTPGWGTIKIRSPLDIKRSLTGIPSPEQHTSDLNQPWQRNTKMKLKYERINSRIHASPESTPGDTQAQRWWVHIKEIIGKGQFKDNEIPESGPGEPKQGDDEFILKRS